MFDKTYICSATEAREADYKTIQEIHIPSLVLMEHAAIECVHKILPFIQENTKLLIVCGPGNNGGDGLAIARLLYQKNIVSTIYAPENMSHDEQVQWDILKSYPLPCCQSIEETLQAIQSADIIIDCLFGNGLSRDIQDPYKTIIEQINQANAMTISIDIPSGIHATTGQILNVAIQADVTISLDCFKEGQWISLGHTHCGKLECVDIGIPSFVHTNHSQMITQSLIQSILPTRSPHSHKGTFKKALMIGGSVSMHGALSMAAKACYQSGIGTLTLMIPESIGDVIAKKIDFAMNLRRKENHGFFDENDIEDLPSIIPGYDILSIGNGMGQNKGCKVYVQTCLESDKPVLLDADACWALQDQTNLLHRNAPTILTPHIKEMSRIIQKSVADILSDPFTTVKEFCHQYPNCILVLKSEHTWIGYKDQLYMYSKPNSALAKGGSGDILCGILCGLLGQTNPLHAALCAVYIQSQCATIKKDPACVMPQDLIDEIPHVFAQLRKV